jgi:hypothetical protein
MENLVVAMQLGAGVFLIYGGLLCFWHLVKRAPAHEPRLRLIVEREEPIVPAAAAVAVEHKKAA